ncbi:MAG: Gfo/Idh/MocA family oxidoreductase [Verrucomicrobiota bacterium]|nr:Gfo/Idh/MocA family oxidoreductase [Verrucomicrobiota bacterium]
MAFTRKLKMGMVGGGPGAFIGNVHRMAANIDGNIELTAGAFSSDPEKSKAAGRNWFLDPKRVYGSFAEMAKSEAALPVGERIDFVTIVTPNHMHFPVVEAFLKAGINVVSDKPATFDLDEAKQIAQLVEQTGKVYALTHNYSGYPMVKEAREMVRSGALGRLLKVVAEYPQGWLLKHIESDGQKQAKWRTDPKQAGASCCIGDIGTHAEHLARFITGLEIDELCADFTTFVPGRPLEDDGNILVHYKNPYDDKLPAPRGIIYASQISAGEENGPHVRVYGTKGSIEWHQPEPNQLICKYPDRPMEIRRPGNGYNTAANAWTRLPPGHPEAFLEAFANIYREAAKAVDDEVNGRPIGNYDFPSVRDAILGMAFIETTVKSASNAAKWTKFPVSL